MRRELVRSGTRFGILLAALLAAGGANAQAPSATATAEALFAEGRRLASEGNYAAACPKFEAAEKVAPSPGTLLNLADCYEKTGRVASAWASFRDAVSLSRSAGRADLVGQAQRRAAALEGRLSKLTVTVTATAPSLEVFRDAVPVPKEAWATPVAVDPGEHVVEARAPGRKAARYVVLAPPEGQTTTLNVPELDVEVARPVEPTPAPTSPVAPVRGAPVGGRLDATPSRATEQKVFALVTAGAGLVALGVGGVFALSATGKRDDSLAECGAKKGFANDNLCTEAGKSLRDDALAVGNIATVFSLVGLLGLGAGGVLWFTAPRAKDTVSLRLAPTGLVASGRFQ